MSDTKKLVDGVLALNVQVNDSCDMSWCPACPAISVQSVKSMDELDHEPDCIYELAKKMNNLAEKSGSDKVTTTNGE